MAQLTKQYNLRSELFYFNMRAEIIKRFESGQISLEQLVRASVYLSESLTNKLHLDKSALNSDEKRKLSVIDQIALTVGLI